MQSHDLETHPNRARRNSTLPRPAFGTLLCRIILKPKDNAVKQELEKAQEASMGILKVTRELSKAFPNAEVSGDHHKWKAYMEWVRKTFATQLKSLETEF